MTRHLAREIATAALGRDPGPMTGADSLSHQVYVGADVVVKVIEAGRHPRLEREIALAPHLPAGVTAPLLDSGVHPAGDGSVRFACYARMPGEAPGMGLPGAGEATARDLAEQAVRRLRILHDWAPPEDAGRVLRQSLDHGGFAGRTALIAEIDAIAAAASPALVDGLLALAEGAPEHVRATVPVHADCHWGNWLAADGRITALLDFEWARFGDPMDDWFFVIADSGPHRAAVLDVVAGATGIPADVLRAECEIRHVSHLAADVRLAVTDPAGHGGLLETRWEQLHEVIDRRTWQKSTVD
ncbi:phosphotransferase family protein [Actinoplanes sp. CA-252034]|uniref:phosphotransferase family protein n=1 Tax=Actinoplanes sp. CA-252034 TaxID=3239906 RepID=UPI003D9880DD